MQKTKPKILIADKDTAAADELKNSLQQSGYDVLDVAGSGDEVIRLVRENRPDLILMAVSLKGSLDGIETAEVLSVRYNIPVIYLADYDDRETLMRIKVTEPYSYLVKPLDARELEIAIEMAFIKRGISFEDTSDPYFPAIVSN